MFVSISLQALLNVEALNMVESIGNYTRHRRAPVVLEVKRGEGEGRSVAYVVRYVPAISGESLAHAYQEILANIAEKMNLPVCPMCARGEFVKHADERMFGGASWEGKLLDMLKDKKMSVEEKLPLVEGLIIGNCVVEDVGGFMYAGKAGPPVKRTSRIQFSYALPVLDAVREGAAASEPQFHVRHVPSRPEQRAQMIYYVETGSALYTFTTALDVDGIGRTSLIRVEEVPGRRERVEAALRALTVLVCNALFGAKRSRFTPAWSVVSMVAAISKPMPFMVSSGHSYAYIDETCRRAVKYARTLGGLGEEVKVFYYAGSESVRSTLSDEAVKEASAVECSTPEEVMEKVIEEALKGLKGGGS